MLAALIKQEYRDNTKHVFKIIAAITVMLVLAWVVSMTELPVISGLAGSFVPLVSIALPAAVIVQLAGSYWQSMYGPRGYATHSLPVPGRQLYWSKTIVAISFGLVATILAGVGMGLSLLAGAIRGGASLNDAVSAAFDQIGAIPTTFLWFAVLSMVGSLSFAILSIWAIMSIGAQAKWNHMGFGAPLVGLILYYVVSQVINMFGILVIPGGINMTTGEFSGETMLTGLLESFPDSGAVTTLGLGFVPLQIALTTFLVWWGIRSIERHTSLR
ncbi:hypothetical protein [Schaalia vaccimaxillae]|uniref:hypothetical protein n=1 Tax=Schaalia vaccimaxillae TaxID=183916 RepID=UPI0003B343CD|nr:hypothetical protein [Schaalia vaccimaxillae]